LGSGGRAGLTDFEFGLQRPTGRMRASSDEGMDMFDPSKPSAGRQDDPQLMLSQAYQVALKFWEDARESRKETIAAVTSAKKEALEAADLAKKEALEAADLAKKEALEAADLAKKEALEAADLAKKEAVAASREREALIKAAGIDREALLAKLKEQEVREIKVDQAARSLNFQFLVTAGAAHARGVIETMEHLARRTIDGLAGETDRKKIWRAILGEKRNAEMATCLMDSCNWSLSPRKDKGLDAAKQIESLYAYLCSNVHFADIAGVPPTAQTGIILPAGSGTLEGTYSKALLCLLDSFPIRWTLVNNKWEVTDSSYGRSQAKTLDETAKTAAPVESGGAVD
jgi:hypothetical protein